MRIGIDCRLWNESGVGRYVRNLVKNLQILDHNNYYTLFVNSKDYENVKCQMSNVKWRLVKADVRWHTLAEQLQFPSIINKENLDLMHFPYFSVPVFYNRPFVVTVHDLILHHFPTGLATTLPIYYYNLKLFGYKFVIKRAAQKAKKIITVSNATKNEIVDHLKVDPSKVVVTHEGIDDKIRNKSKIINTKTIVDKYFLYVGNAYPHKNLDRLVQALNLLCHPEFISGSQSNRDSDLRQNDIKMVLVGKEDYFYKTLKEKTKNLGLEKSVIFLGEVNDEKLVSLYKNAKALIVPSLMEGFGLPGLEAMANKCLVLCSDIPSLQEVYGNAAVYFNPYDTKDMVRKMNAILASEERARPGSVTAVTKEILDTARMTSFIKKGLQRAKIFSWEKMARETLKIYESCR